MKLTQSNAITLEREINWFSQVLQTRLGLYFEHSIDYHDIRDISPPDLSEVPSEYARIVNENEMGFDERLVLILALIPHIRPQILDPFFTRNPGYDRGYTEFGGWSGKNHGGFLPTGETASFILAGNDLAKRLEVIQLFENKHYFAHTGILRLEPSADHEPFLSGALILSVDYLSRCTAGISQQPHYSTAFPAKRITTPLSWDDLVLAPEVLANINILKTWIKYSETLMKEWGLEKSLKPGYRSLFYGPPGTGKTLTATLLGTEVGVDVYRIDLSMVVSKYIGETEKNLAKVFDQAQNQNWILFFDEADALFGQRTQTSNSHDRYANQEISYLLQRIEDHPGTVILASNLRDNIDKAFARRFQLQVYFPLPDAKLRYHLWNKILNGKIRLADDVNLQIIAEKYALSGGAITNVVRYSAINALQKNRNTITQEDLVNGVAEELRKEGSTLLPRSFLSQSLNMINTSY